MVTKGSLLPLKLTLEIHKQISKHVDNPSVLVVGPEEIANSFKPTTSATGDGDKIMTDQDDSSTSSLENKDLEALNNKKTDDFQVTADLPLKAYEPIHKDAQIVFIEMPPVQIETSEAERIAVEDIKGTRDGSKQDLSNSLSGQRNALKMFHQRLKVVSDYVLSVQAALQEAKNKEMGNVNTAVMAKELTVKHYEIMRKINTFASDLSKQRASGFASATQKQQLDVIVTALLSTVVKGEFTKLDSNTIWASKRSFAPMS